jgi:citrate synthase
LGIPLELLRGFALLARAAQILGQLAEERRRPMANATFLHVDSYAVSIKRPVAS